uniref:BED-type domain-containing protein n=1 Tax=Panagrolaimus sp. JU765 TaxID=591449 RepID=A0AC34QDI4_9BILA
MMDFLDDDSQDAVYIYETKPLVSVLNVPHRQETSAIQSDSIPNEPLPRKRRCAIDWQKLIDDGTCILRSRPNDERYSVVYDNNEKYLAAKCNNCGMFYKGDKLGGSFYKHLDNCLAKAGKKRAKVTQEQKERFLKICFDLMSELFIPSSQLNSEAFMNAIQLAI